MIPKNTKKILLYLLRNLEIINMNQISKTLNISVGSAFKILKRLEEEKIVLSKKLGNATFYQVNLDNDEALKVCELLLLEEKRNLKGYPKIYSDEIKNFENAELIVIFGSILNNREFNDVDVLFITNRIKEVSSFCLHVSKIRMKPIVPLILNRGDFIREIKNKKEAILHILKTGIILKGESVFLKVIKDAKS